jgi:acyl carrier protein
MIERIYSMSDAALAAQDELAAHVIRVIAATQHLPLDAIGIENTFEELKIDSLDGINIVFALESEFHISIPDEAMQSLKSIRDTVEGVRQLLAQKEQAGFPA